MIIKATKKPVTIECVKWDGENIKPEDSWDWCLEIDPEHGVILNWPKGNTAHVHYKVCDCCGIEYFVDGNKVCDNESGKCCGYVPDVLCPNGEGWGDYMIMDIDENGQIQNWKKKDLEKWVEEATAKRDDD